MRRLTITLIPALFSLTALGQDLLQCVDPDVLNGLLFNARGETIKNVTATLPDSMSDYQVPASFELVGTAIRGDNDLTTVSFKTALSGDEAFALLLGSLEANGWAIEASQSPRQTFNVSDQPVTRTVCRNAERRMLSVNDVDGVRYARIDWYADPRKLECNAEDPRIALSGRALFDAMRAQMPTLDFPPSTRAAGGALGSGMGGSGDTISTSTHIESPDTAASLAEHLAGQLTAQGWSRDAAWSGSLSSGSTWTRQSNDDRPYWGQLEIVGVGDNVYEVGFTLLARPL